MSKISTVYDKIIETLETLFPSGSGYYRLPNAIDIRNNPEGFQRKGYGVDYVGAPSVPDEYNSYSLEHSFTFVCSREVFQLDGEAKGYDTAAKELLEDANSIVSAFYDQNNLNLGTNLEITVINQVGPIQSLELDSNYIRYINIDIVFRIQENIGSC